MIDADHSLLMGLTINIRVEVLTEASYMVKWQYKERDYIIGWEDMSDVIRGLKKRLLSVHPKSNTEIIWKSW